jgi:hypothetical protein
MYGQFEALNAQLIEAQKTIQERDHILSLMAVIDRQLSQKRRELSLLVTQLKYEKQDVMNLEGWSLQALFYALMGCKEGQLEKETAEYLNLKMAAEKCRLTIASLKNQLHQFEAELVVLADCEDEYDLAKQNQIQLLIDLGQSKSVFLAGLWNSLIAKQAQQQKFSQAYQGGQEILGLMSELLAAPTEKALSLGHSLQPWLDYFQNKLSVISYQFTLTLQTKVHLAKVPSSDFDTGIFLIDLLLWLLREPDPESNWDEWIRHLQQLHHKIKIKTDVLEARLVQINNDVTQNQKEIDQLIDELWRADTFAVV